MPETVQSYLQELQSVAVRLHEPTLAARIGAVAESAASPRLRLLIAGSPGSGRSLLANVLLGQLDLLPASPLPKLPLTLTIGHGESRAVELARRDGLHLAVPAERLRAILAGAPDAAGYERVSVRTNAELLKTVDLRIESIEAGRDAVDWQAIVDLSDFTLLVLRAPALLSQEEASFIATFLSRAMTTGRLAVVINQTDLVPAEDRPALAGRVHEFLGGAGGGDLSGGPPVFELSALEAAQALRAGAGAEESGYGDLHRFVDADLAGRHAVLRLAAVHDAAAACLSQLEDAVARRRALGDEAEAERARGRAEIDTRIARLTSRMERAQAEIDVFVKTLAREELLHEVESFSRAFRRQLPHELRAIDDLAAVRSNLPGYVEAVWDEFFAQQAASVQARLQQELERLALGIEADLREDEGGPGSSLLGVAAEFDAGPATMRTLWIPRQNETGAAALATKLQFGGLFMLVLPGLGMLGLASLGAGQILRAAARRGARAAGRQALLDSFLESWPELERQIALQLARRFAALASQLQRAVAELYAPALERARAGLAELAARAQTLVDERCALDALAGATVPDLWTRLSALASAAAR